MKKRLCPANSRNRVLPGAFSSHCFRNHRRGLCNLRRGKRFRSASQERLKAAEQSVARATVQCYAIEGRYPPDLDYLEENYGLILDREHYVYHYRLEGSNLMPEIQVFEEK